MPFVQQRRFRERLHDPTETNRLGLLLHAITVAAIRQVDSEDFPLDHEAIEHQIRVSRNIVLLNAMNSLSIENLQALALIAFDRVGNLRQLCLTGLLLTFFRWDLQIFLERGPLLDRW